MSPELVRGNPGDGLVRIARWQGTCPNCIHPIWPGTDIRKRPGRPWEHARCPSHDRPARSGRQRRQDEP